MPEPQFIHAFGDDALGDSDAVDLRRRLQAGEVSVAEVTTAAIARAKQVNPQINAIELDRFDRAVAESAKPGAGFFAGIPTFIKDNTDVQGLPTNHGSNALRASPASATDPFAAQFLAQGFTLLGKSTLPEFGLNASTEFAHREPTRNPWNLAYSAGASSGGSAALVAAGVVPVAHANDGGGSIRIPAACCGLVGLKASRGRHREKSFVKVLPVNLMSEGIVSRSVRDTACFHAEAEQYFRNTRLPEIGRVEGPGNKRLRIGLLIDPVTGDRTDAPTRAAVEEAAALLDSMGHRVEPIPMPLSAAFVEDFGLYWAMLAYLFEKAGRKAIDPSFDPSQLDGLTRGLSARFKSRFYRAPQAIYRLRRTARECALVFEDVDVVLSPTLTHTTPLLGHISPTVDFDQLFARLLRYVGFTPWANASGGPALSLPLGISAQHLPLSVQLFAGLGQERTLLELAYEIEQARPWARIQDNAK
jgi:amidase